ncbi:hypothetical protein DPMN_162866 [Dreissena polymorpha]|uniref:Uncharacterized protein n=1 Tax=Dreissena polymorpha TaxID=45954 RepID=A0A9D4ER49_DREPO|nr:hypothetical protein DPMN_162866 [Dreissena polymorpha]
MFAKFRDYRSEECTFHVEVILRRYKQRLQRPSIGITDAADLSSHASGSDNQQASGPQIPNNQRRVNTDSSNNSGQSARYKYIYFSYIANINTSTI